MDNERLLSDIEIRMCVPYDALLCTCDNVTEIIKAQDAKSIAACDKWWIKTVDALMSQPPCAADDCMEDDVELKSDTCPCDYMRWQSLKQSLEAK
jgi:hypothetical protein